MEAEKSRHMEIPSDLIMGIKSFPSQREIQHCGKPFAVPAFDIYAVCPYCRSRIKVRSFSAVTEIEDVFDAVFEWMNRPEMVEVVRRRRQTIKEDSEE